MDSAMPSANRRIVALNRDLFFGVRLKQLGASLGYAVEIVPDAARFLNLLRGEGVALGIIDINASPDWALISADPLPGSRPPILAFGPHMDVEGMRSAKAAGVTRVVSNGQFHRDPAGLIARYAGGGLVSEDEEAGDL
jgi:hypothetical protein